MCPFDSFYDWQEAKISDWKRCFRIALQHGFNDIIVRGHGTQEIAHDILRLHHKDLEQNEKEFLEGLLK